jgi:Zn-dependent peptidase ImmA (M78 family)
VALSRLHIKPNILTWAVERAGKNVTEYAEKNSKFHEWLNGKSDPTFSMAENFARKFYIPFGYLFLQEPPKEQMPIPFFRRQSIGSQNINISDTVNSLIDRQDWLSTYLKKNDFEKIDFVGLFNITNDVNVIAKKIYEILNIPINWAFEYKTVGDAINHLIQKMEDRGIITSLNSMVGNNSNRPIFVNECRGFCLVDDYAPFIFINSKDAKSAQVFTLMHEFAHILLGYSSGIGDYDENINSASEIERFCDKIATITLVPDDLFAEEWTKTPYRYDILSKKFKVSRFVLARRAEEKGYISKERLFQLLNKWEDEPLLEKKSKIQVDFNVLAVRRSSRTFLVHVCNALNNNQLLYTDAYRILGLKGDTFDKVVKSKAFLR